ncbi:MAG: NAD(P)H-hydrate dehydratase [Chloroflexota bacterium]|nr:MAG: NAD(P)H-hydrate dehydratase [Chloroflexota bacterium]
MGIKIVTAEQMRELERRAETIGLPSPVLMENAGLSVAREIRRYLGEVFQRRALVLVGPGNNGGDGLVAARHLRDWGAIVANYIWDRKIDGDLNYRLTQDRAIRTIWHHQDDPDATALRQMAGDVDVIIDALLGTGRARPITDGLRLMTTTVQEVLDQTRHRRSRKPVLVAVDLPTGLNADTGDLDPAAIHADLTVTLGYPKQGLLRFPGAKAVGRMSVGSIGLPGTLATEITSELSTAEQISDTLPARPLEANKGTFGRLIVVAGSASYVGAAALAAAAATRVGAGLVTVAAPSSIYPILAAKLTETTFLPLAEGDPGSIGLEAAEQLREALPRYDTLLLGCGLGRAPGTAAFVRRLLSDVLPTWRRPAVLDADALNILSEQSDWRKLLPTRCVLTPHPGELSRLSGDSIEDIQHDREAVASRYAAEWQTCLLLKGAFTVAAEPGGQIRINPMANPGLASAGTGDVLAGAVAGLLVQGLSAYEAAVGGAYVHGAAGELVRRRIGDSGLIASDLLPALPEAIRLIRTGAAQELGGLLLER